MVQRVYINHKTDKIPHAQYSSIFEKKNHTIDQNSSILWFLEMI